MKIAPTETFQIMKKVYGKVWSIPVLHTWKGKANLKKLLNSKTIQGLYAPFSWPLRIGRQNRPKFCEDFKRLTSLRPIDFHFFHFEELANHDLDLLSRSLQKLKFLKRIHLHFLCCHGLTDFGLYRLSKWLRNASI